MGECVSRFQLNASVHNHFGAEGSSPGLHHGPQNDSHGSGEWTTLTSTVRLVILSHQKTAALRSSATLLTFSTSTKRWLAI